MAAAHGRGEFYLWRLDRKEHATTWFSGIGAELGGGRWNSRGVKAVYASADPRGFEHWTRWLMF